MAKPTRFPLGIAFGYENQWMAYGRDIPGVGQGTLLAGQQMTGNTAGLFAQASSGPDTSMGSLFYSNNSSATVISLLRHNQMGRAGQTQGGGAFLQYGQIDTTSPPPEGKILRVVFLDSNTTFAQGGSGGIGNIVLASSDGRAGVGNITDFMAYNGSWYQVGAANPSTAMGFGTFVGAGSGSSFSASGITTEVFSGTGTTILTSISGGYVGQSLTLLNNTAGITLQVSTAGNILIAGTNAIVIAYGANYTFTRYGSSWYLNRGAV